MENSSHYNNYKYIALRSDHGLLSPFFVARSFQHSEAIVLSHWFTVTDTFNTSSLCFYGEIEAELARRQVPGLIYSRVEFSEGGILSDQRIYLRMLRERLVFDVCAAPFGRGFFFSLRFAEIPARIELLPLFIVFFGAAAGFVIAVKLAGIVLGLLLALTVAGFLVWLLRSTIALGLEDLDVTLSKSPLGGLYERYFRTETYYRHDTRLVYHTIVSDVVKRKVEEVTAAKGITFIDTHEHNPFMSGVYKEKRVALRVHDSQQSL